MKQRSVHFYSGPGLKLAGTFCFPDGRRPGGRPWPAVVLCHGPGGYRITHADTLMPAISKWLAGAGYASLYFSYRGVRDSEGPAYRIIPLEQVEDIQNAITFTRQQPEVDPGRIGLFGAATGGAHVSYVAAIDDRVKCIVGVNAMGDVGRWLWSMRRYWEWVAFQEVLRQDNVSRVLTGRSRLVEFKEIIVRDPETSRFMAERLAAGDSAQLLSLEGGEALVRYQPEAFVSRISPRAAMWICAEDDTLVPIEEAQSLYEKAGEPKKLLVVKGAVHHALYQSLHFDLVMTGATAWFDQHLMG